jgi:hypothetical protein
MFGEYETCKHFKHYKKQVLKTKDKFVKELGIRYIFGANISVDVEGFFNSFNFVGATHVVQVGFSILCFTCKQFHK